MWTTYAASSAFNDSLDSIAVYMAKVTEGELGTPRPYSLRHDDVLVVLLLLGAVLLTVAIGSSMRTVKSSSKAFFFPSAANDVDAPPSLPPLLIILCMMTCFTMSLCSFIYANSEVEGFFVVSNATAVAVFFAAATAYFLLKWGIYAMVNHVLFGGKKSLQWTHAFLYVTALEGVLLFPLLPVMFFFGLSPEKGLFYFIFVLLLCKILTFFKSRSIFFRQKILFLQNIMYFCTLEMTPLLALGGVWLMLAHFLKVKF